MGEVIDPFANSSDEDLALRQEAGRAGWVADDDGWFWRARRARPRGDQAMSATSTPIDEWKPPTRTMDGGSIIFDNWQSIVACIDHAYAALGRTYSKADGFPVADWNLAGLAIDYYQHASRATCCECRARLWPMDTIRCLDCKAALCASCAPKHFWPQNGQRPAPSYEQIRPAIERALEVGAPGIGADIRTAIVNSAMMRMRAACR